MKLKMYPKITVILRGYSYEEAMLVIECLADYPNQIAVEVTTNNHDYLKIIKDARTRFDGKLPIGVGTILEIEQAKAAANAGAQFMLGPCAFSQEIFTFAKAKEILTVPAAFTPTEIKAMYDAGADIIKLFPARTVSSTYFKDLQAPFGPLPLMAVGGVNATNAKDFFAAGASYVGIGNSMFNTADIKNRNKNGLKNSIETLLASIEEIK